MSTTFAVRGLRGSTQTFPRSSIFAQQWQAQIDLKLPLVRDYATESSSTEMYQKPHNTRVNPPASTLPPPLETPEPDPSASTFIKLFKTGKAYLTFYKTGAKAIFTNLKLSQQGPQKIVDLDFNGQVYQAVKDRRISRADYQLLLRNWHDVKRVPIFGLIFLVCGEFTPFVVIAISGVVPYTCRIPKQISSDRSKLEERRKISFRNLTEVYKKDEPLVRQQMLHISWSLGLSGKIWDYIGGKLPGPPDFLLSRRVAHRVEYLETDDRLIKRDGGVDEMVIEEVKIACTERGIDVNGREDEALRNDLKLWMAATKQVGVTQLLLTRPNVWPEVKKKD